jgi:hypothetical protein
MLSPRLRLDRAICPTLESDDRRSIILAVIEPRTPEIEAWIEALASAWKQAEALRALCLAYPFLKACAEWQAKGLKSARRGYRHRMSRKADKPLRRAVAMAYRAGREAGWSHREAGMAVYCASGTTASLAMP